MAKEAFWLINESDLQKWISNSQALEEIFPALAQIRTSVVGDQQPTINVEESHHKTYGIMALLALHSTMPGSDNHNDQGQPIVHPFIPHDWA